VVATIKQIQAAAAALGMTWTRIVELCGRDLGEHGVLTEADVQRLDRPAAYKLGDVVAMRGHGRYRATRVWRVSRCCQRVSALYLTPSELGVRYNCAPTLSNITATPLGLINRG
jgi:hypothetical protein